MTIRLSVSHRTCCHSIPLLILLALFAPGPAVAEPGYRMVRSADGIDLLVAEQGRRGQPAILFVHGAGQSQLSFRRQFASTLLAAHHLVAFDLRGHGGSGKPSEEAAYTDRSRTAEDVAAVIAATGLDRPIIVAWSYGGWVVADYVRKFGTSRIAGIVLAGTLAGLVPPAPIAAAASPRSGPFDGIRSRNLAQNIQAAQDLSRFHARPGSSEADRRILFATELMAPAYARRAMAKRSLDNRDLQSRLGDMPLLLVRGADDFAMPRPQVAALRSSLPQARLVEIAGAGHAVFLERADLFDAALIAFSQQLVSTPSLSRSESQ